MKRDYSRVLEGIVWILFANLCFLSMAYCCVLYDPHWSMWLLAGTLVVCDIVVNVAIIAHANDMSKPDNYDDRHTFTCNECRDMKRCEYAWDGYNTHGDCLAEK